MIAERIPSQHNTQGQIGHCGDVLQHHQKRLVTTDLGHSDPGFTSLYTVWSTRQLDYIKSVRCHPSGKIKAENIPNSHFLKGWRRSKAGHRALCQLICVICHQIQISGIRDENYNSTFKGGHLIKVSQQKGNCGRLGHRLNPMQNVNNSERALAFQ